MKSSNGGDQHQLNRWQGEPGVWRVEVHRLVDLWQVISEVKGDYCWAVRTVARQGILFSRGSILTVEPGLVPVFWMAVKFGVRKINLFPFLD